MKTQPRCVALLFSGALVGTTLAGTDVPRAGTYWHSPKRGDRVAAICPGSQRDVPKTIYTKGHIRELREAVAKDKAKLERTAAAAEVYASVSDDEYRKMIIPYSGYPAPSVCGFVCPLCGRVCGACDPQIRGTFDIRKPYQVTRRCCDTVVYERQEDAPADHKYRPNGHVMVRHFDGTPHRYPYWKGKDRLGNDSILFPRSLVWQTRMEHLRWHALRCLADAYLYTGAEKYARKALVILKRLAEIYPSLPLWGKPRCVMDYKWLLAVIQNRPTRHGGLARGKDKRPLSRGEFEAWPRPSPYAFPPWSPTTVGNKNRFGEYILGYSLRQLPRAFLIVETSASMEQCSVEWFREPGRLEALVRENLFEEIAKEFSACPVAKGNYAPQIMSQAVYVGIAARDRYLFNTGLQLADILLLNHAHQDVAFEQGSVQYVLMMSGYHNNVRNMLGALSQEREAEFPFARFARDNMARVAKCMSTFRGVLSGHGDGNDFAVVPTDTSPYKSEPQSRFLPGYGFAVLCSGARGRRTESMLLFDRNTGHNNRGNLNLQLGFEGMLVAPELGYCANWRMLDTTNSNPVHDALMKIPYRYRLLENRNGGEALGHLKIRRLAKSGAMQNTVLVNERAGRMGWATETGAAAGLTLSAPSTPGGVGATLQVAEAEDRRSLPAAGVGCRLYRRAVLNVERPDGRSYVVDIFRVAGGQRHCYQLKLPRAHVVQTSLGKARPVGNAQKYLNTKPGVLAWQVTRRSPVGSPDVADPGFEFMNVVKVHSNLAGTYHVRWLWDPSLRKPGTDSSRAGKYPQVVVDLHGVRPRDTEAGRRPIAGEEVWLSRAHYPMRLTETVDGKQQDGAVAFENGMSVYTHFRMGSPALASRFTHVVEMYTHGGAPAIKKIVPVAVAPSPVLDPSVHDHYAVGLDVEFVKGGHDVVVSAPDSQLRSVGDKPGRMAVAARFALLRFGETGKFEFGGIINGRGLSCGDVRVASDGDLAGRLVDIIGDITGTRKQSALVIEPYGRWPEGKTLVGERIHVAVSPDHEDIYTVGEVNRQGVHVRVDLEGTPPLGYHWDRVKQVHARWPSSVEVASFQIPKSPNNTYFRGKRIFFPTLGLDLRVKDTPRVEKMWRCKDVIVSPSVDLTKLGVRPGTPLVIYGMAVGQMVRIPSRVAVRHDGGARFTVQSNVDFVLRKAGRSLTVRAEELGGAEKQVTLK